MARRTLTALLLALLLLLALVPTTLADEDDDAKDGKGKPERDDEREGERHRSDFERRGDKWILHNDNIAVWFHQGKDKAKPDIRVVVNGTDDEKSGYRVKILRICEAAENSTQCRGNMPRINLAKMDDWNVVTEQVNDSLTLTMVLSDADGIVTLVWHLNTTSAAVKFDVKVDNWRWRNASDHLLLDLLVIGKNLKNETGAKLSVEDAGYISWETTATATYPGGATGTLNVSAHVKGGDDHDEDEDDNKTDTHLVLSFDGPGGYTALDYDPTFGVQSGSATGVGLVPALGIIAGVAVVAGAALVLRRKK